LGIIILLGILLVTHRDGGGECSLWRKLCCGFKVGVAGAVKGVEERWRARGELWTGRERR
jgi:hypothetical protein